MGHRPLCGLASALVGGALAHTKPLPSFTPSLYILTSHSLPSCLSLVKASCEVLFVVVMNCGKLVCWDHELCDGGLL